MRPGSPFVYGGFTSNVDMKSGAPAFGTPEYMKTAIVGGQLARRLGLPYRSSNANAANSLDAQAAYESVFSLWGAIMGGVNFLMHGAGWMEGGLQASFEKMALDADLLAMVAEFLKPLRVDDARTRAGGDARGRARAGISSAPSTPSARYRTAFFAPMISDWRNYETWREAGSPTAVDAAERIVAERLARLRRAAVRAGAPRGARSFRRTPQGRGRRADRLLSAPAQVAWRGRSASTRPSRACSSRSGVGVGLWGGASGAILARAGVDPAAFGVMLTAYTGAYLVAMSAGGALAHRFRRCGGSLVVSASPVRRRAVRRC